MVHDDDFYQLWLLPGSHGHQQHSDWLIQSSCFNNNDISRDKDVPEYNSLGIIVKLTQDSSDQQILAQNSDPTSAGREII